MVEKPITSPRNVIEFARYQQDRSITKVQAVAACLCRHCGAALAEGENEDECSSAFNTDVLNERCAPRKQRNKFYAE